MISELLTTRPSFSAYEALRQSYSEKLGGLQPTKGVDGVQTVKSGERKPESESVSSFGPDYQLALSPAALERSRSSSDEGQDNDGDSDDQSADPSKELTQEEKDKVEELKARDAEVRAHEQAHLAAAGRYAKGGISFEYEKGPDQRNYAVGGEVSIDTSPVKGDPEASLQKARQVQQAASAPAEPSSQDRAVAAAAAKMAAEAQQQLAKLDSDAVRIPAAYRNTWSSNPSALSWVA